jgi:DNA-binding NtrC family response regulator
MPADRILLVDDEKDFIETLSERMEVRGMAVVTADNGYDAIEKTKKESFDAVILDLQMPGLNGIETLRRLLEIDPNLQVIMLTGHATVQKGVEAVKLGAADFLEKPAELSVLIDRIKEAKVKRMVLVEKENEEKIRAILKSKGW